MIGLLKMHASVFLLQRLFCWLTSGWAMPRRGLRRALSVGGGTRDSRDWAKGGRRLVRRARWRHRSKESWRDDDKFLYGRWTRRWRYKRRRRRREAQSFWRREEQHQAGSTGWGAVPKRQKKREHFASWSPIEKTVKNGKRRQSEVLLRLGINVCFIDFLKIYISQGFCSRRRVSKCCFGSEAYRTKTRPQKK